MRSLFLAAALGFFAVLIFSETLGEPETRPALAAASFPNADPVIVNLDTKAPLSTDHRHGVVVGPPTRRSTLI